MFFYFIYLFLYLIYLPILSLQNQLSSGTVKAAERLRNFSQSYINPSVTKPSTAYTETVSPPQTRRPNPPKLIIEKEPLNSTERSQMSKMIQQGEDYQREIELLKIEIRRLKESQALNLSKSGSPIRVITHSTSSPPMSPSLPGIRK